MKQTRSRKAIQYFHNKRISRNLRRTILIIGILLTLWRGYECLQKFYNSNLSTRVSMSSSADTIPPVMVICPDFVKAYKENVLAKYGIKDRWDYMKNNLHGNDSTNEKILFERITNNFSEIVQDMSSLLNTGKKFRGLNFYIVMEKRFLKVALLNMYDTSNLRHRTYGRCFEVALGGKG